MNPNSVVIVDYGLGNLFNLRNALEFVGAHVEISGEEKKIDSASRLVLPGVGSFGAGITNLKAKGLIQPIQKFAASGKPLLGICLGMQLLMSRSEEKGDWQGLDLIPGNVTAIPQSNQEAKVKIPQIGWNYISPGEAQAANGDLYWKKSVLEGLTETVPMYFIHSYIVNTKFPDHSLAISSYGGAKFSSAIQKDNISGCQFHPERSSEPGLRILKNFISLDKI